MCLPCVASEPRRRALARALARDRVGPAVVDRSRVVARARQAATDLVELDFGLRVFGARTGTRRAALGEAAADPGPADLGTGGVARQHDVAGDRAPDTAGRTVIAAVADEYERIRARRRDVADD